MSDDHSITEMPLPTHSVGGTGTSHRADTGPKSSDAYRAEGAAYRARPDAQSGVIPAAQGASNQPSTDLLVPRNDAASAPFAPSTLGAPGPATDHLARHSVLQERIRGHLAGNAIGVRADLEHPDTSDQVWSRFNPNSRGK